MANNTVNKDVSAVMNIGFDMIMGPCLRWKKELDNNSKPINDYDQFAMSAYLAFKGGNDGGPRPQAIVYDNFSVVGFPKGMDLVCLFLKNNKALTDIARLRGLADEFSVSMENEEEDADIVGADEEDGEDYGEIKRIVCNMLRNNQMSTPEIRKHFELTNSGIWKIMGDLEHDGLVNRAGKDGRAILWTLA